MSTLLRHAILLLGIIPLVTCTHEKDIPVDCGDAQTIAEMKEWVFFKTGTYWIYEEQNTGALDTVTVIAHSEGVSAGGFETFGTLMHSSFDAYNYDYWFNDSYSGPSNDGCNSRLIFCDKYKPGNFIGSERVFVFPLKIGRYAGLQWGGGEYGELTIMEYPSECIIDLDSINQCVKFSSAHSVQNNWLSTEYILGKGVGIIEERILGLNETWTLVEFVEVH